MNNYELLYILPTNITGEEIKTAFLEIEKNILKLGGKKLETLLDHPFLIKAESSKEEAVKELKNLPIVKRRLAYPIKKNRAGFYCLFNFNSQPNNLKEIDTYLRTNNDILRHLIIQADPMTKEELKLLEKLFKRKRNEQEKQEKSKQEKSKPKEVEKESWQKETISEKQESAKEEIVVQKIKNKTEEEQQEEPVKSQEKIIAKPLKEKKERKTTAKKKIKLEDLENKLDEILEDATKI